MPHGCRLASPTPIMASGMRSAASIEIVAMSIVYPCVCCVCVLCQGFQWLSTLSRVARSSSLLCQLVTDHPGDDGDDCDDEDCSCHCVCFLVVSYTPIISISSAKVNPNCHPKFYFVKVVVTCCHIRTYVDDRGTPTTDSVASKALVFRLQFSVSSLGVVAW